ncbi:hypothetical protein ACVWZ4_002840 [Bradyrhizobium sp. USDA 4472]
MLKAPADIFALFDTQGDDFKREVYLEEFALYRWTYVAGFPALVQALLQAGEGFSNRKEVLEYIVGQRGRTIGLLPREWRSLFEGGNWDDFNGGQVESAARGEPLRLDKACCCVLSAELALHGAFDAGLRGLDLYSFVRLRPAIYVFRELDARQRSILQPTTLGADDAKLHKQLIDRVRASSSEPNAKDEERAKSFLALAAQGAGMTLQNARSIKQFFHETGCGHVSVVAMPDRTNAGQKVRAKNCNTAEGNFIDIEDNFAEALRKIRRSPSGRRRRGA